MENGALDIHDAAAWDDSALVAHEAIHVEQWRRLGWVRFLVVYLGEYLRANIRARTVNKRGSTHLRRHPSIICSSGSVGRDINLSTP